jgi:hypothetical protein
MLNPKHLSGVPTNNTETSAKQVDEKSPANSYAVATYFLFTYAIISYIMLCLCVCGKVVARRDREAVGTQQPILHHVRPRYHARPERNQFC